MYRNNNTTYINDETIFKYINPDNNDKLSEMNGLDLQYLLVLINGFFIKLRKGIGLDQYITFGLEIEFENVMREEIELILDNTYLNDFWSIKGDSSLFNGAEINSPVLTDTYSNWNDLNKVCSIVEPLASIDTKSGGHVHIGTQILGNNRESWLNFIKMWSVYENIIYRFAYGDYLTARPRIMDFAEPMTKDFWHDYETSKKENENLNTIIARISHKRNQAVNFNNVSKYDRDYFSTGNTIEFRCPNGSLDPAIWQNNVNLFAKLLQYSDNTSFYDDTVQKRHNLNLDKYSELKFYNEIYLEQALELCDLIFTNNLDKIYFLKQYLKSFQTYKRNDLYPKAQVLTKKSFQ